MKTNNQMVLLLNSSEEIITVISWKRAVMLLFSEKAYIPYKFEDFYRISTVKGYYDLPTALILKNYVKIPFKTAILTRDNIFKRDRYTCQYCGEKLCKEVESIDHIVPKSKGGLNEWKNMVACCLPCNSYKADRTPEQAGMKLLHKPFVPTKNILLFSVVDRIRSSWGKWYFND